MKLFSLHVSDFYWPTICLLLQKFSKVRAAKRQPGPRAASGQASWPVGRLARVHFYSRPQLGSHFTPYSLHGGIWATGGTGCRSAVQGNRKESRGIGKSEGSAGREREGDNYYPQLTLWNLAALNLWSAALAEWHSVPKTRLVSSQSHALTPPYRMIAYVAHHCVICQ